MSNNLILNIILVLLFIGCFNKSSNKKEISAIKKIIEQNEHLKLKQTNDCSCQLTMDYLGEGIGEIHWMFNLKELDKIDISKSKKSLFLRFNNRDGLEVSVTEWLDSFSVE